ncbi:MAG: diguanylate cyclase [Methylophilaceae bacterium]
MLKYDQDRNASAELFRLVLQQMSKYTAAFTPCCYAVWYEYLAGINLRLKLAMDERVAQSQLFDDAAIEELFQEYVSELRGDAQRLIGDNAQRILNDILRHAEEADHRAHEYGENLQQSAQMLDTSGAEVLRSVVTNLQADTHKMRSAVVDLQGNLAHSRQEIETLKRELEHARVEALTDPLTGALNRRGFDMQFSRLLAESETSNGEISLIMLDIDHFKKINDTHGHLFGDKVIRGVAEVLKANVKGRDAIARLGGEEFGVLLPDTSLSGAQVLADRIRLMVEKGRIRRQDGKDEVGGITISLGVAELNRDEDTVTFLNRADKALYFSKENGRNRVSIAPQ